MTPHELSLVAQGLARVYRGRLIPIIRGGSDDDEPEVEALFAEIPEDLATLDDDALAALVDGYEARVDEIAADHASFVTDERPVQALLDETNAAVAALELLQAEQATRAAAAAEVEVEEVPAEEVAAQLEELATRARAGRTEDEVEVEVEAVAEEEETEEVVAAGTPVATPARRPPLPRPPASRQPVETRPEMVALTAAGGVVGMNLGTEFESEEEIANAMIRRRGQFGTIPPGTRGEKYPIAVASWSDLYPAERRLNQDELSNLELVAAALNPQAMKKELQKRRIEALQAGSLVASGGLCAPVTPYYQLQMISQASRPVRAALPAFNADRGGIRYARPASLAAVAAAVGTKTVANDFAGGTEAEKTCQVIPCPPFSETDIEIIYHCLQFGNLGARTFPELVQQWNNLVLADHARVAESLLLTGIDVASTQVTAGDLGLGASATLFSQILAAANGLRNRHRMDPEAVLRLMMPDWAIDFIISDVIRTQFQRFDTDEAKVTALLRSFDIEPTFYIDSATNKQQVFGTQGAGALLGFPETVNWFLYPEGSFLYLDGGTLELGIVRDSVLNKTNDFQIFGESFENVAFIGVESLSVVSTVCDSGVVAAPVAPTGCGDY